MKCKTIECGDDAVFDNYCGYCLDQAELEYQEFTHKSVVRSADLFD